MKVLLLVKPATFLKVIFLHECFSRFLNCTNDIKSRKHHKLTLQTNEFSKFQISSGFSPKLY